MDQGIDVEQAISLESTLFPFVIQLVGQQALHCLVHWGEDQRWCGIAML